MTLLFSVVFVSSAQIYLNSTDKDYLYQLAIGDRSDLVLALDEKGTIVVADINNLGELKLANTLWCVEVAGDSNQGANVVYSFLNKATGQYLAITMQDFGGTLAPDKTTEPFDKVIGDGATIAGGEIYKWKFSDDYNNKPLLSQQPLYAFFNGSYSIGIRIFNNNEVRFVKRESSDDILSGNNQNNSNVNNVRYTNFTLQKANKITYLSKDEFNSVLGNQDLQDEEGVELVFGEELVENPFAGKVLFAEKANIFIPYGTSVTTSNDDDYLYIRTEDNLFLMVDTANYNQPGENRYLRYKWVDFSAEAKKAGFTKDEEVRNYIVNQLNNNDAYRGHYMFRFAYNPSENHLTINVAGLIYANVNNKGNFDFWPKGANTTATITAINAYLTKNTSSDYPTGYSVYDVEVEVYKQSYDNKSQLTVASIDVLPAQKDQNVTIGFAGFAGCNVSADKTSISTDLYVITDGKGKYLAVPIHQARSNSDYYGGREAEWVTLERNVNPWTMPAFQWVVEKKQTADILKESSPIKITNREYGDVVIDHYQLYSDKGSELAGVELKKENFKPDTLGVKADPYVGYRMFNNDSLLIAGYTFKYLHELGTQDLYLKIGGDEVDSVLYVSNENKLSFALDTVATEDLRYDKHTYYNGGDVITEEFAFGYTPKGSNNKPLTGWKELERRVYTLKVKGAAEPAYVVLDDENRYSITKYNSWDLNNNPDNSKYPVRFYLKANNEKDGEIYYALIDATSNNGFYDYPHHAYLTPKGGVDDNSLMLKSNDLIEKRTSAFAIEIDDTPLYRRFANDPAQGAYANGDGPDTMRFYEKYRHEYLQMESNPNFMKAGIDFLGINAKSEAKGGLAFQVDSAWIGRGLGYIKPQYLISIDRNDQAAVEPIACPEEFHGNAPDGTPYDKWTCPHATKGTPGFNRGRYLINFEFQGYGAAPGSTDKEIAENEYMWKKFYRAGFVDAAHIGDSLYILRDEFAGVTNAHIDTAKIKAAEAAWRKADKNVDRSKLSYYIIDLTGDKHKFATWSMRYVEPENTATNKTFLMESMNSYNEYEGYWIAPTYGAWLKM
ncbi:MAG: hypothetical protein LUG51_13645 [Tannerellaceae bacterium]|nr:hypothetical protein [Tannerellaceae bacterium]